VTSPPYWGLRDYGVEGQFGLEKTPEEYVEKMVAVFDGVRRVLRDDGTLWLNIGDCYSQDTKWGGSSSNKNETKQGYARKRSPCRSSGCKPKDLVGIPWMLAFALRADGWYLRSEIIWHKPNPMPESVRDRPTNANEKVFLFAKSRKYFYDMDAIRLPPSGISGGACFGGPMKEEKAAAVLGSALRQQQRAATKEDCERYATMGANARNVWTISTHAFPGAHFATFPPKLAENCIKAGTSQAGCCPRCNTPWNRSDEKTPIWRHGFNTSCNCNAGDPIPCVVLDLFGGAGTTGLVADRLGRDAILIELNPKYADMARKRITDDAGMFACVET